MLTSPAAGLQFSLRRLFFTVLTPNQLTAAITDILLFALHKRRHANMFCSHKKARLTGQGVCFLGTLLNAFSQAYGLVVPFRYESRSIVWEPKLVK